MLKPFCCLAFLSIFVGCASSAPPTRIESALFSVQTNWITNIFNVVQVNPSNNVITNTITLTNVEPRYHFEPKQATLDTISTASSVATTSGVGWAGLAGTFIASLLYGWAEYRNSRKSKLNTSLAQSIEVGRETIKAVGGLAMEARYVEQVKSEQASAGVKVAASTVSAGAVNTVEAKASAEDVVKPITEPVKP